MTQDYFLSNVNRSIENINILEKLVVEFNEYFSKSSQSENFNIIEMIRKVLDILNPSIVKHAIYSSIIVDDEQINLFDEQTNEKYNIFANKNEFMQVLINLLNNAKESIKDRFEKTSEYPEGLIKIVVSTQNEDEIKIEIIDNGTGLDYENKENIFDAYFSTKQSEENVGIGLYVCKKIIEENMNSKIELLNNENDLGAKCILQIKKS